MAASPKYKIYTRAGEYIGSTVHVEDAALLVSGQGDGATIRNGHKKADTLWTEGVDGSAYESSNTVVNVCNAREAAKKAAELEKRAAYMKSF